MPGRVNGFSLAYTATGAVVLWSGIRGTSISDTFKNLIGGKPPGAATEQINTTAASASLQADLATGTAIPGVTVGIPAGVASGGGTPAANKAAGVLIAASFGWAGAQFTALNNVEEAEAGWNNLALNPSSGAFGVAQALGHGTAGTGGKYGNQYGANYGLTTASAIAANNGSFTPQFLWMCGYIKARYGTPAAAWAHEQANRWY